MTKPEPSEVLLRDSKTALMYEELRAAIDGGHESMTHADALAEIAAMRALSSAKVPPAYPAMPENWGVVASVNGENILCIGDSYLHGKRELSDAEEQAIVGMAQHLLAFVGYGLPPSSFDPDADEAPQQEATAAPHKAPAESEQDLRTRFEALARDSYNFKRSRRDCYVNPTTARDWKWFRLGAMAATEGKNP